MENMLKKLIAVLEEQARLYRTLLDILHEEKKALVCARIHEVNAVRLKKDAILSRIHAGDDIRGNVIQQISEQLGCPPQGMTITQLAQRVEAPFSLSLIQCATDIFSLIEDIRSANDINKSLINHSLQLIRSSIRMLVQAITPSPVYFRSGRMYQGEVCGSVVSGTA